LLCIKNLSFSYLTKPVLNNISFKAERGEVISILGENGSGKSTLLKLIGGCLQPAQGEVILDHKKIKGPEEKLIPGHEEIKIVFQDFNLAKNLSVYENIYSLLPPVAEEKKIKRTDRILRRFKLLRLAEKKVEELSGGEKQRVSVARAFATGPAVLLLDEPFSNVDIVIKEDLKRLVFAAVKKEKITAIFVTHDREDALKYSDKLLILRKGRIVSKGTPFDIYHNPPSFYAAAITGVVNNIPAGKIPGTTGRLFIRPENVEIKKDNAGGMKGVVVSSYFLGSLFETHVYISQYTLTLKAFSSQKWKTGGEVFVQIKKKHS
jgi:iron(III) transport system ATP-binding protein